MCSRFSLAEDNDFLAARLGVSAMALANYPPRYNITPQEHFIVTTEYENRKLASAKWGLVFNPGKPAAPSIRSIPSRNRGAPANFRRGVRPPALCDSGQWIFTNGPNRSMRGSRLGSPL